MDILTICANDKQNMKHTNLSTVLGEYSVMAGDIHPSIPHIFNASKYLNDLSSIDLHTLCSHICVQTGLSLYTLHYDCEQSDHLTYIVFNNAKNSHLAPF
jgi:hypothetical protein